MLALSTLVLAGHLLFGAASPAVPPVAVPGQAHHAVLAVLPAVAGKVVTEAGEPLPGVFVAVQGTPQATSTNSAGNFLLTLSAPKSVLVFKCQGYRDQMLAVAAGSLTVKMLALTRAAPSRLAPKTADNEAAATSSAANTAQPEVVEAAPVLNYAEVMPTFPGGDAGYRKYIGQNAHFPAAELEKGLSGTVYVSFVVDEQGRIIDVELSKGCGNGFDQEALRIIRLMPWWNPGMVAGKPVRVGRILPVPFVYQALR